MRYPSPACQRGIAHDGYRGSSDKGPMIPLNPSYSGCGGPLPHCVDVTGIGFVRKGGEPSGNLAAALPACVHEALAFAQRRIEARVAERQAPLDAGGGHLALDGGELE